MKRVLSKLLVTALTVMSVPPAGAHAQLERAVPAAGTTVHASPSLLKLWFTERLEPAFSDVRVFDRNGTQVDEGDAQIDRADAKLFRVSLPKLAPGKYLVKWRVLSVDTHIGQGTFAFSIAP